MAKLTTVYFTWNDLHSSSESFKDNWEFYRYVNELSTRWLYPTSISTYNEDWIWEWCDDENWNYLKMKIIW